MIELSPSQFALTKHLFSSTRYGVLAAGTLEGGHPGRLFVDNAAAPQAALLCTLVGYYFLAGDPTLPAFNNWLPRIFCTELAPRQMAMLNDPQVLLFYPNSGWSSAIREHFSNLEQPLALVKKRMVLPAGAGPTAVPAPEGFHLRIYDRPLLEQDPELGGEAALFYGSLDHFLSRSLGVCLLDHQGQTASTCHAVFTGCGEAELSIATAPEYRRRGLAHIAASAFIAACRQRGLAPVWGCFPENQPSVALARKLGFVDDIDQQFYLFQHLYGGPPSDMPSTNTATA